MRCRQQEFPALLKTCMERQVLEKGAQGPNAWLYRISPAIRASVRLQVTFAVPQAYLIFLYRPFLLFWNVLLVYCIYSTIMLIKFREKPQETCLKHNYWWSHLSVLQENPQNCKIAVNQEKKKRRRSVLVTAPAVRVNALHPGVPEVRE